MAYRFEESGTFLAAVQSEYQNEMERASALDTRLSISLPIVSAYFLAVVPSLNLQDLFSGAVILIFLDIAVAGFALLAVALMVCAVLRQKFYPVNLDRWDGNPPSDTAFTFALAKRYLDVTKRNRKLNGERGRWHFFGWCCALLSLICYVVYRVVSI